ncbi:Cell morphogenesis protein PAG1 [Knufia fluminis]|uniref:Cell morphogenesis protein PAG1 n=1 Tax=Knufia fluminis TaxID=191047 RepID=A0AAN8FCK2_9EURO|nr:Cell morphogenesis protein PAG1 [Knufia fluminis]
MPADLIPTRQPVPDPSNSHAFHESTDHVPLAPSLYRAGHVPNGSQSRDPSVTRGRNIHGPSQNLTPTSRAPSAQPTIPEGEAAGGSIALDTGLQRRTSNRHHRQTSVINGLQHSRNPSFNSPLTASPLSPESLHNASLRNAAARRGPGLATEMDSPNGHLPLSAHFHGPSIDSTLNLDSSQAGSIASIRTQASTSRGGRGHAYGASVNTQPDGRTPSQYAMHHLFNAFVIRADQKINHCLSQLDGLALPVERICGIGGDPVFDQLMRALGHVTRLQPKALVDSLMFWRQNKADNATASRKQLNSHRSPSTASSFPASLERRHTEPLQDQGLAHPGVLVNHPAQGDDLTPEDYALLDKQATVSIFILCRGLMEVFEQSTLDAITPELAMKLEDIVFEQLKAFDPTHLNTNKIRAANWRIYGQLLGRMSRVDFSRVTNRFLQQLKQWQEEIAIGAGTTAKARDVETRIELLLLSMQHLHLKTESATLPQSYDFLVALAQLFANSHGPRIKQAYCAAFEALLLQIASQPEITARDHRFKEFVDIVNPRINQMLTKMRHWSAALPTSITLLCLSALDIFHSQWMLQMNALSNKLRDRSTRTPAMRAMCQLTWAYLHRSTETAPAKMKKTEEALRLVFPPGRKLHITTEPSMAEATLCFVRLIAVHYSDLCFKLAIFPLVNPDSVLSGRDLRIEQLEPEKVTIGIKSFLLVMDDKEKGLDAWREFPEFVVPLPVFDSTPSSPMPFALSQPTDFQSVPRKNDVVTSTTPINVSALDEGSRTNYSHFCEMLGRITVLCDGIFGSSAALNEKFSMATPKTPLVDAFALNKREDGSNQDQKYSYYDLLKVAIQALPRCLSDTVPLNPLINLLCTASAHIQPHIAFAATRSLKAIAGQGNAQPVATAFPRFIFSYDHQYSTMSDEGRLDPTHIETALTLYLDLLQIWVEQLRKKSVACTPQTDNVYDSDARALRMEMTTVLPFVDEIEGYGLFFLCSQSRKVRAYAIKVLETVLQFDEVLGRDEQARIVTILSANSEQILDIADDSLTLLERSRLQKDRRRRGTQNVLFELSSSENYYDSALWFKAFPNMVRHIFEICPHTAALSREFVCDRLALMLPEVERIVESPMASRDLKLLGRSSNTPVAVFFDQWKLYLIMACVTLSSTGGQSRGQLDNILHSRKTSRNTSGLQDKLSSARSLFSAVIPLLGASLDALRSAVVTALGSINRKLYRILLESLQYAVVTCNDEAKARRGTHQRTPSSPSRSQMTDRMRIEVTCIYKLTASFLRHDEILKDEWILNNLMNYAKELRLFLSDSDVHVDWKFSRLRFHYCGLVEVVYDNIRRYPESSHYMSFESRKSAFTLMEEWCGYQSDIHAAYLPENEPGDNSTIVKDRVSLRTAALSSMAALCAGPVSVMTETNTILQFNIPRILSWIDSVFTSRESKLHEIGQRALKNLILHNANALIFVEHAVQCCYGVKGLVALENCFNILADVLMQQPDFPISTIKVLGAVIFTLGHESRGIRIKSARLLRFLDDKEQKSSNLQHFDISISDKTRAVYKAAQFEYSRRLAQTHPDLAFHIFSEFCLQFRNVSPDIQRGMVAAILPWLQTLELQVLPNSNQPTDLSYMLLVNMIEITVRSGGALHNEVQALWQALATGPYGGNVQLVLDFIIDLSLERREQNFVYFAKQIVVFLSVTPAGSKIFQHFLQQLAAKNMPNERKAASQLVPDASHLPYVADLETLLPTGNRQATLSLGQMSMIFLVDLLVPPIQISQSDALKLLHTVFILWDHHTPSVQEHARELLVHLMHVLVVARHGPDSASTELLERTEELVEAIRNNDIRMSWSYGEMTGKDDVVHTGNRVPTGMSFLAEQVVEVLSSALENFSDAWAREALHWASVCPVRHLACRSFQVFRCTSVKLDSTLLSDMLARLSNTIAEEHADYQTFSLEILTTLKVVIAGLEQKELLKFPQLLWTTVACLNTIHEREFCETLGMLEEIAKKFDFSDPVAVDLMMKARPDEWEGEFEGIQPLVYKGLKSSGCLQRSLSVLEKLGSTPDSELLGSSNRLLFNVLAHLPSFLQSLKQPPGTEHAGFDASHLASSAQIAGHVDLATALNNLSSQDTSVSQRLAEVLDALSVAFFPAYEAEALIFVMGLLTNATTWFRVNILDILCQLIPLVDKTNPKLMNQGADLISPLLRLLQTELCDQALAVMDHVTEVNVTPLERHHLRMSMASGPARAIRKEYERTQSLYGIPETTGWSIPTPAIFSAQTRNNVHHVFFACSDTDGNGDTPSQTPEVEFHAEDDFVDSYFPPQATDSAYSSFESATDITMGDIVSSLDSFDDFFDENDSPTTPTAETGLNGGLGSQPYFQNSDHGTDVYDQQTAPIISRSYARSSSSMSFHNAMSDSRPSTSHQHRPQHSFSSAANSYQTSFSSIEEDEGPGPSMPTVDKASPIVPQSSHTAVTRPNLHARSITSPANQYPVSHPTSGGTNPSMPEGYDMRFPVESPSITEDFLSDSENSPFPNIVPTISHGGTKSVSVTPTSATDTSAGFMRRGMRRLTGGKSESAKEKARLRAPSSGQNQYNPAGGSNQSPRMPRIPSEYLNQPQSAGTPAGLNSSPLSPGPQ